MFLRSINMSASVDQKFETFVEENISERQVTDGAGKADGMEKVSVPAPQDTSIEDLGGPTNQNYKQDDNSSKIANKGTTAIKGNAVNKNAGAAEGKPAGITKAEEVETKGEVVEEELNVDDDVKALLTGEELSEEFKAKTKTIFEAAIKSKISEQKKKLEEEFEKKLSEELEAAKTELSEKTDKFLSYVAEEWKKENEIEIHKGIKLEMYNSFMDGMKKLFEENYAQIPEEKYDVLEEMTNKLDEMEEKLNEQLEKNVSLNGQINTRTRESLIAEVSKGLAQTQAEKLASLAESVEFESEESFKEKLDTLKENYFPKEKVSTPKEDVATGDVAAPTEGPMAAYVKAISQWQ